MCAICLCVTCLFFANIIIVAFLWISFFAISSKSFFPDSIVYWSCQLSIELIIGNNLPNQISNSLSCWKCFIPDDVFTFITASLQILMQRLNFCRIFATLKGNFSPLSPHLSFNSPITFL